MKLGELFPELGADLSGIDIVGVTADSRKVQPGYLFAALLGSRGDGRSFIDAALAAGAAAVLTDERPGQWSVPVIHVPEPRLALARVAAAMAPRQPSVIAAVTGTNGKSSTVDFLRQIWGHLGHQAASMGTLGAVGPKGAVDLGHTTPDPVMIFETLQSLADDGVTHVAMEASSHGLDQYRLDGVRLSVGAFTNLTQDHLDYHTTFEDYRSAKLRLFSDLLPVGASAVINADSPELDAFSAASHQAGLKVVTVGWRGDHVWFDEIIPRGTGQDLRIQWEEVPGRDREEVVHLPLIGEFQALNVLCAVGIAYALGEPMEKVLEAIPHLRGVRGRLELVGQTPQRAPVFVDYAHTPDGLEALLRAVRPHVRGRLVLVFGCGGDRDPAKRSMMGDVARRLADDVIITDDNPRSEDPALIRSAIRSAAPGASDIGDRRSAIFEGVRRLRSGDALLIAGKGHETGQIVKGVVTPFSDHEAAEAALADLGGGRT